MSEMKQLHTRTRKGTIYQFPTYISIDLKGEERILCISINYRGAILAESTLPENWQLFANDNRIICISSEGENPDMILKYTGKLEIVGGVLVTESLTKIPLPAKINGLDYWNLVNRKWRIAGDKKSYLGYNGEFSNKKFSKTSIVRNNLYSNGEIYTSNGAAYTGAYHQHQNGAMMSGHKHTSQSKKLYRRDINGNLYDPLKGAKIDPRDWDDKLNKEGINRRNFKKEFELFKASIRSGDSIPIRKGRTKGGGHGGAGGSTL